jgi:hypothetical protein
VIDKIEWIARVDAIEGIGRNRRTKEAQAAGVTGYWSERCASQGVSRSAIA